jgi:energy-coupling factor transporter transmembrane protein EcfT
VLVLLSIVVGIATAPRQVTSSLVASAALALGLVALARPAPAAFARRAALGALAIAAICLPIAWTDLDRAVWLGGRAAAALVAALALASTIAEAELGPALSALGAPRGVSAVVASLLRQTGSIAAEGRRLALARSLRGATGIGASTEMFAALLARSAQRAERVELALRLRGYDERVRRPGVRLALGDVPAIAAAVLAAVAVHWVARL